VSWNYDNDFRKVTETVQAGTTSATAAFGYDSDSLLTCVSPTTCPSGNKAMTITRSSQNGLLMQTILWGGSANVWDTYTYNTYGELATYQFKYSSDTLYSMTYDATGASRDALGRVVQKTETARGTTHVFGYTYDVQGRLTDVTRDGTAIEHYGYDLNGNRTTATVNGVTVNPTYDDQDRLLTYGGTTFAYTANGELRTKTDSTGTTTYTYDAMGSLIAVSLPDGRLVEYVTDGKWRRIGKMVNGVLTKQWIYRDQLKPVAELDGSGNLVCEFIYGTKANVPDLVVRGGATYRIVSDQLGSPLMAINAANSRDVPFAATYAAFGERTLAAGIGDWTPFGFAGGHFDSDTKLTRFGARDFDPILGRWVSKDPILFKGNQGNIYMYTGNDPVNQSDPQGLTVYACQEMFMDKDHWWAFLAGYSHAYLNTDSNTFGLYPDDNSGSARILDDNSSGGICNEIPDVDEDCVDNYALYNAQWGAYGWTNNCGTFVAEVLNRCRISSGAPYPRGGF